MKRGRLLAVALALGLLAGCVGVGDEAGSTDIQFLLFGGPEEVAGYRELITAFGDVAPEVEVTLTPVATQDELLAKLTTSFAGGAPPDVFLINFRKYGQFASEGVLAPVQPRLDASEVLDEDDFVATPLEAFRFDGDELTCMPQNVSSLVVYTNEDLLDAAGVSAPGPGERWSFDEFVAAAEAVTDPDAGVYGVGVEPSIIRVAPFVWSAGGEVVDDPTDPTRLTLTDGPAREALDRFLDLALEHAVVPPEREELSEDGLSRFLNGRLGMFLSSRREVPTLRTIEDFTWDVAPLPTMPGGSFRTILHADAYCLARDGDTATAWRFVEFAMSEPGQRILARSGRTVPSRRDVADSPDFLRPDLPPASARVFLESAEAARATPHTATWVQVEREADHILEDLFYGRVARHEGIARLVERTRPLFGG